MGCDCNHKNDHHDHKCGCREHKHTCGCKEKDPCNHKPYQSVCVEDTNVCLTRKNMLSEFKTDIEKSEARNNLGITDEYVKELINQSGLYQVDEILYNVIVSEQSPENPTEGLKWYKKSIERPLEYDGESWVDYVIPNDNMLFVTLDEKIYEYSYGSLKLLYDKNNITTKDEFNNSIEKIKSDINNINNDINDVANSVKDVSVSSGDYTNVETIIDNSGNKNYKVNVTLPEPKSVIVEGGDNVTITPSETDTEKKFVVNVNVDPVDIPDIVQLPNHDNDTLIKKLDNGDIAIGCKSIVSNNGSVIIDHNYKENDDDEFEKINIIVNEPAPVAYAYNLNDFLDGIKYLNSKNGGTLRIIGKIKLNKLFSSSYSNTRSLYEEYGIEFTSDYYVDFKDKINTITIEGWSSDAVITIATVQKSSSPEVYTNCTIKADRLYLKNLSVWMDMDEYSQSPGHFSITQSSSGNPFDKFEKNTNPFFSVKDRLECENCVIYSQSVARGNVSEVDFMNAEEVYKKEGILFEASGNTTISSSSISALNAKFTNCKFGYLGFHAGDVECTNQNYLRIIYKPEANTGRRLTPQIMFTTCRIPQANFSKDYKVYIDCDSRISSSSKKVDMNIYSDNMEININKPSGDNNFNYIIMK